MKKKLMAFWPYASAFSNKHFCCGVVTDIDECGNVETDGYGKGHYFKPVAFFPVKTGMKLKETLDELEERHEVEARALRQRHFAEVKTVVDGLLPFNKGKV
jgi:hypothetical protein